MVDPGDEAPRILRELGDQVKVKYLLHTHGHLDHIGASRAVKEGLSARGSSTPPQIAIHREDEPLYLALQKQGALFGMIYEEPLPVDRYLEDGEEIQIGKLRFSVIHTPGHSPGSVCLRMHEDSAQGVRETLYSGDTLFQGSVGRTDLWGADQEQMFSSIRNRILTLDDETRVCPGHGPETKIGIERRENPFLV